MEFWLDTPNCEVIKEAYGLGILYGVTTNPALLAKVADPAKTIKEILDIQQGPVAVQVIAQDAEGMIAEGRRYYAFSPRIIVKIPVISAGIRAIHTLSKAGIPTMGTVILDVRQALLGALAGAQYLAPYFSHIDKLTPPAIGIMEKMLNTLKIQGLTSKVLVASLQTSEQAMQCAEIGIPAMTLKDTVFQQMIETTGAVQSRLDTFDKEWKLRIKNGPVSKLF